MATNAVQNSMHKITFRNHIAHVKRGWLGPDTPIGCVPCKGEGKIQEGGGQKKCPVCKGKRSIPYSEYMVPRADFVPEKK